MYHQDPAWALLYNLQQLRMRHHSTLRTSLLLMFLYRVQAADPSFATDLGHSSSDFGSLVVGCLGCAAVRACHHISPQVVPIVIVLACAAVRDTFQAALVISYNQINHASRCWPSGSVSFQDARHWDCSLTSQPFISMCMILSSQLLAENPGKQAHK